MNRKTIELWDANGDRAVVEPDSESHARMLARGYTDQPPKQAPQTDAASAGSAQPTGLDRNVADILPEVEASEDAEQLQAWLDEETGKDKPRKGLVAEIEKRLKALGGQ